jgi:hypothetical protein
MRRALRGSAQDAGGLAHSFSRANPASKALERLGRRSLPRRADQAPAIFHRRQHRDADLPLPKTADADGANALLVAGLDAYLPAEPLVEVARRSPRSPRPAMC